MIVRKECYKLTLSATSSFHLCLKIKQATNQLSFNPKLVEVRYMMLLYPFFSSPFGKSKQFLPNAKSV